MAKVIWKGEDSGDVAGPSFTTCYGLKFPKDVPVEVMDPDALRRARGNLQFKVLDEMKQEDSHGESQTQDKVEDKKEDKEKDYREREKGTGYSPVKKKVRKKKPEDKSVGTTAARVPAPDPRSSDGA